MIPITVQPKLISIKNRWRNDFSLRSQFGRDLVLGTFSILVMASIYYGLDLTLTKAKSGSDVAYLPPGVILDILLLFLLGLLMFSNAVSTLGLLLLSEDLMIFITSPIKKTKFFWGKLLEVSGTATWMVLVFGLPAIIAFGSSYSSGIDYYFYTALVLLPYFLIPSALSITVILLFTSIVPATRTKEILVLAGAIAIIAAYFVLKHFLPETSSELNQLDDILYLVQIIRLPDSNFMPSHWAAVCIGEYLQPTGKSTWPYLSCLYGTAVTLCAFAFLTVRFLHERAYSMSQSHKSNAQFNSDRRQKIVKFFTPFMTQPQRALLSKEISLFIRDMTQTVQLMLLLGLCSIYLYNLRILRIVEELPEEARVWWQAFLTIGNMAMGAFVIAAVCTRFVFPSISLEGKAYWILRCSPIPLKRFLRAKFFIWYLPVSIIGSILLMSGSVAINADAHVILLSGFISWVVCYGIVGLGIGLGAVYANFNWEHSSQLAASFGSLIYMVSSTIFIGINLVPPTVLIIIRNLKENNPITDSNWYFLIASCICFLIYLNLITTRWALRVGENALKEMESR